MLRLELPVAGSSPRGHGPGAEVGVLPGLRGQLQTHRGDVSLSNGNHIPVPPSHQCEEPFKPAGTDTNQPSATGGWKSLTHSVRLNELIPTLLVIIGNAITLPPWLHNAFQTCKFKQAFRGGYFPVKNLMEAIISS